MSKRCLANRVKRLSIKECNLSRKEALLAKSSAKFHDAVAKQESQMHEQRQQLHLAKKLSEKLHSQNEKLQRLVRAKQARLEQTKARVEQFQKAVEQTLRDQVQKRQHALQQMNKLCTLKECTNIFINLRALPGMVQGVTLCEEEESTEWIPFSIAPTSHTQEEVQNFIWDNTCNSRAISQEWANLFFDSASFQAIKQASTCSPATQCNGAEI